jgi:hypothetical protein
MPDRLAVAQSRAFGGQRLSFADGYQSLRRAETLSTAVLDSAANGRFWPNAEVLRCPLSRRYQGHMGRRTGVLG